MNRHALVALPFLLAAACSSPSREDARTTERRVPELAEVRSRVEKMYENFRRAQRVSEYLDGIRPQYTIEIDESAIDGGSGD